MILVAKKHSGLIQVVKTGREVERPDRDGISRKVREQYELDFGGQATQPVDGEGRPVTYEDGESVMSLSGGVLDTDLWAAEHEIDPETKLVVEDRLRQMAGQHGSEFYIYTPAKPVPPWPRYDQTQHSRLVVLAEEFGVLPEALAYEQRTKNRPGVIAELTERLEKQREAETLVAPVEA